MEVTLNGKTETLTETREGGTTVTALLESLHLPPQRVAVEINEDIIPRKSFAERVIKDGDRIEVVTFVGGG